MKQVISIEATTVPYKAIPIWEALPIQSGAEGFAIGRHAPSIEPRSCVVESIGRAAHVSNINRHSSGPRALAVRPLEIARQRLSASPFFAAKELCTVASRKKPGNLTKPASSGRVAIHFVSESGLVAGRSSGSGTSAGTPMSIRSPTRKQDLGARPRGGLSLQTRLRRKQFRLRPPLRRPPASRAATCR